MASASDLRDILSLPEKKQPPPPPKKLGVGPRKESGITRELYSLIGNSAPTLVAQYARPKLKAKPDLGRPRTKWEWQAFTNPARTDGLELRHWVKKTMGGPTPTAQEEYSFAKFNNNPSIALDYSMDEYNRLLEDPDWTREETDYLFALVKEYDVRFFVITDRYDYPGGKPRNIVDLKGRYYGVCRRLVKNRPFAGDEASKAATISSYSFDRDRENTRRSYLHRLHERSPEEIADEEALYIECKRIEQNERRFQKDRDDLLRTLGGIDSGLGTLRIDDPSSLNDPRRKKKRMENGMEVDSPASSNTSNLIALPSPYGGNSGLPNVGRPKSASVSSTSGAPKIISVGAALGAPAPPPEPIIDPVNCMVQIPQSALPLSTKTHKPVHLRSTLFPQPRSNVLQKVNAIITELGIHPSRLVMPTQGNITKMEELHGAALGLLEMKKTLDRVEQEIRIQKARLRGTSAEGTEGDDFMNVDDDVDNPGNKRTQRRSSSISSVTLNQRPNLKRQRRD